jgi:hypothetical protein
MQLRCPEVGEQVGSFLVIVQAIDAPKRLI